MYSVVIPVYNRPEEVDSLLASLTQQTRNDFEVVVVDDGSSRPCKEVCSKYAPRLNIKYYEKENSGPGLSRNYGAERASGDFFIIFDSDVVVPENYLAAVAEELDSNYCDVFGGADAAHPAFSTMQKAISYAMTSFFTTGGIRGGRRRMDRFYPRSFNMGVSRAAFTAVGGFDSMRYGEDIDLSIRLLRAGYACRLFPAAWVWHKRRTNLRQFFRQVFHSGQARIALYRRYPASLKVVHVLPTAFVLGTGALLVAAAVCAALTSLWWLWLMPILLYALLIFVHAGATTRSLPVALCCVPAAFVQLYGYGIGFLTAAAQKKK